VYRTVCRERQNWKKQASTRLSLTRSGKNEEGVGRHADAYAKSSESSSKVGKQYRKTMTVLV